MIGAAQPEPQGWDAFKKGTEVVCDPNGLYMLNTCINYARDEHNTNEWFRFGITFQYWYWINNMRPQTDAALRAYNATSIAAFQLLRATEASLQVTLPEMCAKMEWDKLHPMPSKADVTECDLLSEAYSRWSSKAAMASYDLPHTNDTAWAVCNDQSEIADARVFACSTVIASDTESPINLALAFNHRGLAYFALGQADLSMSDYDRAVKLNPNNPAAFNNLGTASDAVRGYDAALESYDHAIKLNPSNALYFVNRGNTHRHKHDYIRAIADYTHALELQPDYVAAFANRGIAYYDATEYDLAIKDYNRALQLDHGDFKTLGNRANAFAAKKEYRRAIADYDQIIDRNSGDAAAFYNRGLARKALGQRAEAAKDLAKAKKLDPSLGTKEQ
jgi:tetratricopeptide (TPR) repeat protein